MTNNAIIYLELRTFLLRGNGPLAGGVLLVAVLLAGWGGGLWRDAQRESVEAYETAAAAELATWRETLADIEAGRREAGPFDANPMSIAFPAALPPSSLADFAIGHAELQPATGEISPWRNAATIFQKYQFDNPTTLAIGRFDLSLVIVMLLPVLMIAVSFDVIARERTQGTLALIMSHPVTLSRLAWTRLLLRNAALWAVALGGMLIVLFMNDAGGDRYARFALWLVTSFAYAIFWLALIACCVAAFRSLTGTAAALVSGWLLLVLALPAAVETVAEAAFPTPSRLAYLSEIRQAQADTNRSLDRLTDNFLMDHPELSVGDEGMPAYMRATFLANEISRQNSLPIVQGYEEARSGRARTLAWAQLLSPAIATQRALNLIAGGDLDRQHRFQTQAGDALSSLAAAIGPSIVSRNRLSLEEFDSLAPFRFHGRTVAELVAMLAWPVLVVLAVSGGLTVLAVRLFSTADRRLYEA